MKSSTKILLVGIVMMAISFTVNMFYEDAKAQGYEIDARITRIVCRTSTDPGMDDTYVAYGEYEVDGKKYSDKRLGYCSDDAVVGESMKIVVDPDDPEDRLPEGGVLAVFGLPIVCYAIYLKHKERKAAKSQA